MLQKEPSSQNISSIEDFQSLHQPSISNHWKTMVHLSTTVLPLLSLLPFLVKGQVLRKRDDRYRARKSIFKVGDFWKNARASALEKKQDTTDMIKILVDYEEFSMDTKVPSVSLEPKPAMTHEGSL